MRGVLCVLAFALMFISAPVELFAAPRCVNGQCSTQCQAACKRPPARSADKWPSRGPIRLTTGVGRWLVGARMRSVRGQ